MQPRQRGELKRSHSAEVDPAIKRTKKDVNEERGETERRGGRPLRYPEIARGTELGSTDRPRTPVSMLEELGVYGTASGAASSEIDTSQRTQHPTAIDPIFPESSVGQHERFRSKQEIEQVLLKTVTAIFESKGNMQLLDERNATLRMIQGALNRPSLQEAFMELLDIPPSCVDHSLAQTALALRYTSKYMELLDDTIASETTGSAEDNSAGVIKINSDLAKAALEAVQEDKAKILIDPSKEIFLPVKLQDLPEAA